MRPPTTSIAIANQLKQRIQSGEYPHSSVMPTELELSAEFGAARNTIRKAIDALVREGIVLKHQGRQSRVNLPQAKKSINTPELAWFSYLEPANMASNSIYFELFRLMTEHARSYGLNVQFLTTSSISDWRKIQWDSQRWSAFFAVGISKSLIDAEAFNHIQALPYVIGIDENDDMPGFYTVTTDNFASARIATAHLFERGCRHPAFINTDIQQDLSFRERQRGFEEEHRKAYGSFIKPRVFTLKTKNKNAYECCQLYEELVQNRGEIDGFFCASDTIAIQVTMAALRYGISIPQKLKIIGYDGIYAGQHVSPRLTTVAQPLKEIVEEALVLALQHEHASPRTIKIPGHLILGETT